MIITILKVIICHMLGDYVLQSNYIADEKGDSWYILLVHCVLYSLPFLIVFGADWKLAVIFLSHVIIDPFKARWGKINLLQDQVMHYAIAMCLYLL